jgi:hypothetical protein
MANESSDIKHLKSASRVSQFFNLLRDNLSYGKLVRASLFILLAASVITTLLSSPTHAALISLAAFVAFDVVCAFKRPKIKDHSEEIKSIRDKSLELEKVLKEVKGDMSVVKMSSGIRPGR